MRYWEILAEATTPKEEVVLYYNIETDQVAITIGGRVIDCGKIPMDQTLNKVNLKNVRSPNGPLLYHGSVHDVDTFKDESWFSADPSVAVEHGTFWRCLGHGKQAFIYVCSAEISKAVYNPDIQPGSEQPGELTAIYDANPDCDAIIWKATRDAGAMQRTDLYNIKSGQQVRILKRWAVREEDVDDYDFKKVLAGKDVTPEKDKPLVRRPGADFIVTDPGLGPFEKGEYITAAEYREWKDHLAAEKADQFN